MEDKPVFIAMDLAKPGSDRSIVSVEYHDYIAMGRRADLAQSMASTLEGIVNHLMNCDDKPLTPGMMAQVRTARIALSRFKGA